MDAACFSVAPVGTLTDDPLSNLIAILLKLLLDVVCVGESCLAIWCTLGRAFSWLRAFRMVVPKSAVALVTIVALVFIRGSTSQAVDA